MLRGPKVDAYQNLVTQLRSRAQSLLFSRITPGTLVWCNGATDKGLISQQTFNGSKSTIETLERGVKYVQSQQLKHQNAVIDVVLVFLLLTLNIFHTFLNCVYCYFEQVNLR